MPLKVREVIRLLERHGWVQVRTKGDHRVFRYPDGRITVISGATGTTSGPARIARFCGKPAIEEPEQ